MVIAPPTSHVWAQGLLTIYDWGRGSQRIAMLKNSRRGMDDQGESHGESYRVNYSYHTWADANIVHVLWKYLHNVFHFYPKCCWFAGFCVHHLVMIHVPIHVTPLMVFSGRLPLDPSKFTIPFRNPSCSSHLGGHPISPPAPPRKYFDFKEEDQPVDLWMLGKLEKTPWFVNVCHAFPL